MKITIFYNIPENFLSLRKVGAVSKVMTTPLSQKFYGKTPGIPESRELFPGLQKALIFFCLIICIRLFPKLYIPTRTL